jgi:hypothetical protein
MNENRRKVVGFLVETPGSRLSVQFDECLSRCAQMTPARQMANAMILIA